MTCEKLRAHRQLVCCKAQRLPRDRFRHAIQLEQNVARPYRGDPVLRLAFPLAHARFRWAGGYRLIRENADPQLAFALHVAGERDARGLQLRVSDPGTLEYLQSELAKIDFEIARSSPFPASPLGLSILHTFWHQCHRLSPLDLDRLGWRWWWWRRSWLRRWFFLLTNPTFHTNLAINCVCFCEAVIDRRAQGVKWNFSLPIPFRAGNLRAIEPARTPQTNSFPAKIHRSLHRFFHRAAIGNPPLDLERHIFGDELCVEFRRFDFLDIDLHLFALGHLGNFFGNLLDLCALSSDHNPGTRGVDGHPNGIPRALNHNFRNGRELQLLLHIISNLQVAVQK